MAGTTGITRGGYAGRETKLYYNTDHDTPSWVEMKRVRNISITDGPALSESNFHGEDRTGNIPGYSQFSGSFEYVLKQGTDTVFAFLQSAQQAFDPVELDLRNQDRATSGSKSLGMGPVLLGEFELTSNGGDDVVYSISFGKADAYDSAGDAIDVTYPSTA